MLMSLAPGGQDRSARPLAPRPVGTTTEDRTSGSRSVGEAVAAGLLIGILTAAVALRVRQRLPIATRSRRVLAVAGVSGVTSGALAWVPAHWAATSGLTAGDFAYPVVAAVVSGLVAATTEHRFESR